MSATTAPGTVYAADEKAPIPRHAPLLIELDGEFWRDQLDRTETFLGTVVLIQAGFRTMADDVLKKVGQSQFHHFLQEISADAHRHEAEIAEFYRMIGRDPARGRATLGTLAAKGRELLADVEGFASGASSPWRDLRQLWMASHSAEGALNEQSERA